MNRGPRSHCPVSLALEAIGDRWSLLVLRDLVLRGKTRYQELLHSEECISTNILADRLLQLERKGLISKVADPDDKRQFHYSPTEKALDLLPVIAEMARWSAKYHHEVDTTHPYFHLVREGNEAFTQHFVTRLESGSGGNQLPRTPRKAVRGGVRPPRDRARSSRRLG